MLWLCTSYSVGIVLCQTNTPDTFVANIDVFDLTRLDHRSNSSRDGSTMSKTCFGFPSLMSVYVQPD